MATAPKRKIVNTLPVAGPNENPIEVSSCIVTELDRHDVVVPAGEFEVIASIDVPSNANLARITLKSAYEATVNIGSDWTAPADEVATAAAGHVYPLAAGGAITEVLEVAPSGRLVITSTQALTLCSVVFIKGKSQ